MAHRSFPSESPRTSPRGRMVTTTLAALALIAFPQALGFHDDAVASERAARAASAGNGVILMVHSTFEPHSHEALDDAQTGSVPVDQVVSSFKYGSGSVGATRSGEYIVFHAIPYLTATVDPVVVRDPQLEVTALGSDRRLVLRPNVPADQERICQVETSWMGHEGPVEACTAYKVPVEAFDDMKVVTLTLHFLDAGGSQEESHSLPAHALLHSAIYGAPVDLNTVDGAHTEASPLIIENLIDTQRTAP
jgi:hypothetical protein